MHKIIDTAFFGGVPRSNKDSLISFQSTVLQVAKRLMNQLNTEGGNYAVRESLGLYWRATSEFDEVMTLALQACMRTGRSATSIVTDLLRLVRRKQSEREGASWCMKSILSYILETSLLHQSKEYHSSPDVYITALMVGCYGTHAMHSFPNISLAELPVPYASRCHETFTSRVAVKKRGRISRHVSSNESGTEYTSDDMTNHLLAVARDISTETHQFMKCVTNQILDSTATDLPDTIAMIYRQRLSLCGKLATLLHAPRLKRRRELGENSEGHRAELIGRMTQDAEIMKEGTGRKMQRQSHHNTESINVNDVNHGTIPAILNTIHAVRKLKTDRNLDDGFVWPLTRDSGFVRHVGRDLDHLSIEQPSGTLNPDRLNEVSS